MIMFYMIVFILLGLIALANSAYIFLSDKSFIYLPYLYKKNDSLDMLKYQAYTQIICGLIFILYSIAIFHFNISSFISHISFFLVSIVFISILGHIKLD